MAVDNRLDTIFTNKMAREKFSHIIRNGATDLVSQLQHKAREHVDLLNLCETQTQRLSLRESLQICTTSDDETALCKISVEGIDYPVIISATESVPNKFCHYSRSSIAWVYIIDASYGRHLADNSRFQNLSLSKTEKELCIQLFEGKPLSDIAAQRRVSEQTVRKQLQSTLRKTELESQEELIIFLFEQCIEYGLVK
jgi:DNA-binding NarL/FixJ family response regulator